MTKIMQELSDDPGCSFTFSATLPSGNEIHGCIGPVIGDNVCAEVRFSVSPASEADKQQAREVVDGLMGGPAVGDFDASGPGGIERARMQARRMMGGGMG